MSRVSSEEPGCSPWPRAGRASCPARGPQGCSTRGGGGCTPQASPSLPAKACRAAKPTAETGKCLALTFHHLCSEITERGGVDCKSRGTAAHPARPAPAAGPPAGDSQGRCCTGAPASLTTGGGVPRKALGPRVGCPASRRRPRSTTRPAPPTRPPPAGRADAQPHLPGARSL